MNIFIKWTVNIKAVIKWVYTITYMYVQHLCDNWKYICGTAGIYVHMWYRWYVCNYYCYQDNVYLLLWLHALVVNYNDNIRIGTTHLLSARYTTHVSNTMKSLRMLSEFHTYVHTYIRRTIVMMSSIILR